MDYRLEDLAKTLKQMREHKGLSQRALAEKAGVPQSHISKIEQGMVDLRVSSLIALARALDLELTLVPRKAVPAVQSIARSAEPMSTIDPATARAVRRELNRLNESIEAARMAGGALQEINALQNAMREINVYRDAIQNIDQLRAVREATEGSLQRMREADAMKNVLDQMNTFRNDLARERALRNAITHRPAYRLEDEDDE